MNRDETHKQILRLEMVCANKELAQSAIEYCQSSPWSIPVITEFIMGTGNLPTPAMAAHPDEILTLMRAGVLKI